MNTDSVKVKAGPGDVIAGVACTVLIAFGLALIGFGTLNFAHLGTTSSAWWIAIGVLVTLQGSVLVRKTARDAVKRERERDLAAQRAALALDPWGPMPTPNAPWEPALVTVPAEFFAPSAWSPAPVGTDEPRMPWD